MKKKSSRRRIDVNVDELDRIIEAAMREPLSEADGRTLKTAVHAMAARLVQWRNTEKTSAVLETKAPPSAVDTPPQPERPAPSGHGATVQSHLREPTESPSRMPRSAPAILARNAAKGEYTARKNRRRWSASLGKRR